MTDLIVSLISGGNGLFVVLGLVLTLLAGGFVKTYRAGKKSERANHERERLEALTESEKIEQAIAGNDPDVNREKLKKWGRR